MPFHPQKSERYLCALRNFLHRKIVKNGNMPQYVKMLKKIYLCEAVFYNSDFYCGCDLYRLTDYLFGAAVLRFLLEGKELSSTLSGNGEFLVNFRLYEIAVCELLSFAQSGSTVRFSATDRGVVLALSKASQKPILTAARHLGARLFRLLPNGDFALFLPLLRGRGEYKIKYETEYLYDRYSVLNVFLD